MHADHSKKRTTIYLQGKDCFTGGENEHVLIHGLRRIWEKPLRYFSEAYIIIFGWFTLIVLRPISKSCIVHNFIIMKVFCLIFSLNFPKWNEKLRTGHILICLVRNHCYWVRATKEQMQLRFNDLFLLTCLFILTSQIFVTAV